MGSSPRASALCFTSNFQFCAPILSVCPSKGLIFRKLSYNLNQSLELEEVRKRFEIEEVEERRKQMDKLKAMGKTWGVNYRGKENEARKMMNRILNENKELAMAKLKADQKDFMLDTMVEVHGLDRDNIEVAWKFNLSSGDDLLDDYEDLITAEDEQECKELAKEQARKRKSNDAGLR